MGVRGSFGGVRDTLTGRRIETKQSAYLSPSSLKKSPPPKMRSRKRKRGGSAGRSAPISRDAIVFSDIISLFFCVVCVFPSFSLAGPDDLTLVSTDRTGSGFAIDIHAFKRQPRRGRSPHHRHQEFADGLCTCDIRTKTLGPQERFY